MGQDKRAILVASLRRPTPAMRAYLRERKHYARQIRSRPDLIWHLLLQSFATMGNSRGWQGLFDTPGLADEISYRTLSRLSPAARRRRINRVLRQAVVRMPQRKTEWLLANFRMIQKRGGIRAVTREALLLPSREAKLRFMTTFHGIGPKYGRNVWMDVYDPRFRNAIAVDERIKSITRGLGYSFRTYEEHEAFYQTVATEAGLEPWALDRLLYGFRDHFLKRLGATAT